MVPETVCALSVNRAGAQAGPANFRLPGLDARTDERERDPGDGLEPCWEAAVGEERPAEEELWQRNGLIAGPHRVLVAEVAGDDQT